MDDADWKQIKEGREVRYAGKELVVLQVRASTEGGPIVALAGKENEAALVKAEGVVAPVGQGTKVKAHSSHEYLRSSTPIIGVRRAFNDGRDIYSVVCRKSDIEDCYILSPEDACDVGMI